MSAEGTVNCCPQCREPLVSTFEFTGAELYCPACEYKCGIFGRMLRLPGTDDLIRHAAEVQRGYDVAYAERRGVKPPAEPDPDDRPKCGGCGKTSPIPGKPASWYARTKDGARVYACSRDCIPERETVLPW